MNESAEPQCAQAPNRPPKRVNSKLFELGTPWKAVRVLRLDIYATLEVRELQQTRDLTCSVSRDDELGLDLELIEGGIRSAGEGRLETVELAILSLAKRVVHLFD